MELRDTILDDVSTLKRSAHMYEKLKSMAENYLSSIRDKIYEASQEGQNHILYDMSSAMQVSGLTNRDSQYIVLASIIKSLKKKHYDVAVQPEDHVIYFSVTWLSKQDKDYIGNCKKVVDEHYKIFIEKKN